jgi:hypothetical protein
MPVERAIATSIIQIAPEVTPGTFVPATKRLASIGIALAQDADVGFQGPTGYLFDTIQFVNREWSTSDVSGGPSYTEMQYPLSSLMGVGTVTTPPTALLARDWVFNIVHNRQGTPQTYTVEQGDIDAGTAERAGYCFFQSLNMNFSRDGGNDLGGSVMGQIMDFNFSLTDPTTVVGIPQVPIEPNEVNVYLDLDSADIGTTQWLDAFAVGWSIDTRWGVGYPLNRSKPSYDRHYATKPDPTMTFSVANNPNGRELIDYFRGHQTLFIRIEGVGPQIELIGTAPGVPFNYMYQMYMAVQLSAAFTPADINGLATLDWTGRIVYDGTWDKAMTAKLRNTQTAL